MWTEPGPVFDAERRSPTGRISVRLRVAVLLALALVAATGCGTVVFGEIPPATFQFRTVIDHQPGQASGWQVAQVLVLLGRLSNNFPRVATCQVEVGVPIENEDQGFISVDMAQKRSAHASDRAARKLLSERKRPTAKLCARFLETMRTYLQERDVGIAGGKVSRFNSWPGKGVPQVTFPPARGWR